MSTPRAKEATAISARRRPLLVRFRRDEKGATAVEFGIIALPFIAILFAIIETAMVFFAGQALETAVDKSARLIRTGQAQQQAMSANAFKDSICSQVSVLFECGDKLHVDVRTYANFGGIDLARPIDETGKLVKDFQYKPGGGGDIVVVRAFYEWPIYVSLLGNDLTNLANGAHLLSAGAAFRNEPFPW